MIDDVKHVFWESCINGHLDVAKWLYNLGLETGKPINMNDSNKTLIICHHNEHLDVAKWLYDLNKEAGNPINMMNINAKQLNPKYSNSIQYAKKWLRVLDSIKEI